MDKAPKNVLTRKAQQIWKKDNEGFMSQKGYPNLDILMQILE